MELVIEFNEGGQILRFIQCRNPVIQFLHTLSHRFHDFRRPAAFGRESRRHPFQRYPDIDCIGDITLRKAADDKPACGE